MKFDATNFLNRENATNNCQSKGGIEGSLFLASIHNETQNNAILNAIEELGIQKAWIGLEKDGKGWVWDDETEFDGWLPRHTMESNEKATNLGVLIVNGSWVEKDRSTELGDGLVCNRYVPCDIECLLFSLALPTLT